MSGWEAKRRKRRRRSWWRRRRVGPGGGKPTALDMTGPRVSRTTHGGEKPFPRPLRPGSSPSSRRSTTNLLDGLNDPDDKEQSPGVSHASTMSAFSSSSPRPSAPNIIAILQAPPPRRLAQVLRTSSPISRLLPLILPPTAIPTTPPGIDAPTTHGASPPPRTATSVHSSAARTTAQALPIAAFPGTVNKTPNFEPAQQESSLQPAERIWTRRCSSYYKSQHRSPTFSMAIVTLSSPMIKSPLVSPSLPPPDLPESDYEGEEGAPAPELPRNRDRHRNSELYHSGTVKRRISFEKIHNPTRNPSKRQS
ncbi:hypothetical protein EX30DRAFT_364385 [Ascodesmis nigricans]|uniref:Uncharacterized protein n=1 Tax=Ascodesmis nigricans TaxID=341454 RepID=A0A4S2MVW2_9PEZI|nr:hypothetical protein EX30DRAFT_364385 [Ascodesmis nigricans]